MNVIVLTIKFRNGVESIMTKKNSRVKLLKKLALDLQRPKKSRRQEVPDPDDPDDIEKAFGPISDEETTFWLSTYGKNTPLMQVCHSSDRLSAVFGSNLERDVSVPYLLDDNFDAE